MHRALPYFIFLLISLHSLGQSSPITDGPYLFYKGDYLYSETISKGKVEKDSVDVQNPWPSIRVPVPGKPGNFFTVALKSSLENEPSEFKAVEKMMVLSDIEGTFEGIYELLRIGGVIDEKFRWTFGKGHLVICGDMFDRGDEVTACLWLMYKLEAEAKAKGGYVHVIMGNHEIMNLSEDIRYVHPKYLEAATLMGRTYMDLYTADTELGRWLRTKNIIEKIGDMLFLHAGISQAVNEEALPLKKINNRVRPLYDKDGFDSLMAKAKATTFFNDKTSPFWYRGYFVQPRATEAQVDSTLQLFNCRHIIVGHTIVDSIQTLYNGKVIAIDVNRHTGNQEALIVEKDSFYRLDIKGRKTRLIN